jgi:membrane associated rhomboid family serine protease
MRYWQQQEYPDPRRQHFVSGPRRNLTPVVKWLIIVNVAVFLLEMFTGASPVHRIWGTLGLSPESVFERGRLWQLLTYAFLHDPNDLIHILFNMLFLYWFGRQVETTWGSSRFLKFYLAAAVFSGLCFAAVQYLTGRQLSWCIGASGAIMATVMVYALYWPNQTILFMLFFPMRIRTFVIITIVLETMALLRAPNGVANMAHLGGLAFGFIVVKGAPYLRRLTESRAYRDETESVRNNQRLDEILDKVHRKGMQSLSWWERRFLKKFGRK